MAERAFVGIPEHAEHIMAHAANRSSVVERGREVLDLNFDACQVLAS
jgi:hypothetical protein